MKSLDHKLLQIRSGNYRSEHFIIADAKDGDMAFGIPTPGPGRDAEGRPTGKPGVRADHLNAIRAMTRSGLVDIMLTCAATGELLSEEGLFAASPVTLAVRYNDTTDIWSARGSTYRETPSQPFRSAELDKVRPFVDLGLYSVTFSNSVEHDVRSLNAYRDFRREASALKMRHFLEVFNPASDVGLKGGTLADYVNDSILRALGGVVSADRPAFLKIPFNGRKAMEDLASYDPSHLVVGILGGAAGTTRDTFELLSQAEASGARVALFGRKINFAEDPIALVSLMRKVVEKAISPLEAVKAYHGELAKRGIAAARPLADDSEITDPVLKGD